MNILLWIALGTIIGILSHKISPLENRGGIIGATFLSSIGALLGGFTANRAIGTSLFTFEIESLTFAVIGGTALLVMGKVFSTDIRRFQKFEK